MELGDLPNGVLEDILARLPIPDAVRTSLLSRAWRHRWQSIPCLTFDRTGFPKRPGETEQKYERRLVRAVDRALLLHAGPVHEFKLSIDQLRGDCPEPDVWLRVLSRKDVRGIELEFWSGPGLRYKLPSSLFECELLRRLELYCCAFTLPAFFKGFRNLVTLNLQLVNVAGRDLNRLISACPLLEELKLLYNRIFLRMRIRAPKLRKLVVKGCFSNLMFKYTPVLAAASVELHDAALSGARRSAVRGCGLADVCSALPRIENLEIRGQYLKFLSAGNTREQPLLPPSPLRNLTVDVNLMDVKECMATFWLLRNCCSLEILKIHQYRPSGSSGAGVEAESFWGAKEGLDGVCDKLACVEVTGVVGLGHETAFLRFLIASAPSLVRLNVKLDKKVSEDVSKFKMVAMNLLSYPRASRQAAIILME